MFAKPPYKVVQIVNRKEHTVPHYQWIVVGSVTEKSFQFVCGLSESMQKEQTDSMLMARRIAWSLNVTASLENETLENSPVGIGEDWFNAWLDKIDRSGYEEDHDKIPAS